MSTWWLISACTLFGSDAPPEPAETPAVAAPPPPARGEAPLRMPERSPAAELGDDAGLFRPVPSLQTEMDALESLGYAQGEAPAPARSGVVRHDPARTQPGLNLWASGHAPEAYLMTADGTVVHTWRKTWSEAFGDAPIKGRKRGTRYWRRVELLPDRGLLAIFEGHGLVRLDRDSHVVWALQERVHHDLEVLDDGSLLVLARKAQLFPRYDPKKPVAEDSVLHVSADGSVRSRTSLLTALERSRWRPWLQKKRGDLFHTNSLRRLSGPIAGIEGTRAGQVLVSIRSMHTLAIVDLEAERWVWAAQGPWRGQHDARLLPNGNLLLFDNFGAADGTASAVREIDPATLEPRWTYQGTEEDPFYSAFIGMAQRLPNGNTLVTDGWVGRAFEVTPEGEIVWELLNPHRATDESGEATYIAVISQLTRLVD